ncbi:MarR family transcriptional regulator [Sinorhizobium sp. A49]|uniref:MarR family winged helix-turn-helix transcriptional regulator n=1 Tax=Sinorhizobium sp. A49 TaxID=1945861 RepID=UPI000987C25E|nr:MarR family transcriptional regulator [Sinorhizobium sp. A49]OOG72573.1 MarR family transcriptional regulator [Sinorhizobium sp. A49]
MEILEQKHLALIDEAERRGDGATANLRLCFEVIALAAAIDRDCAARLAPHNLSEAKFVLLFLLHQLPDGLSPHELADRAGVTRATVTGLLDGLERDGFLGRQQSKDDRRKVLVRLSPKGKEAARALFDTHTRWIASLFAGFDESDRQTLSALIQRAWRNTDGGRKAVRTKAASEITQ